jgi:hypothetical protein
MRAINKRRFGETIEILKIKTLAKMSALTVRRENTLVKNNKKKTKAAYATPKEIPSLNTHC